jgi:hypothetical protein
MPLWRRAGHRHKRRQPCSSMKRQQKITLREMRASGVRGVLIYCSDYKCSHWTAISADPKSKVVQTAPDSGRYRAPLGVRGLPMDIVERFYIAAAALGFLLIAAMALL